MRKPISVPRWRQFFLLLLLFILCWSSPGLCADVTLAWDPNSEADLEGYGVYYSQGSAGPPYLLAGYVTVEDLDNPDAPSFAVAGLKEGARYYFAATAYNASGKESAYSIPVCADIAVDGAVSGCSSSPPPDTGSDGGDSSSGGSGGGGGCLIACAAAGSSGHEVPWVLALVSAASVFCLFFLPGRVYHKYETRISKEFHQ